jgi:hypothetical protein
VANFLQQILGTRPASDASEFGYPVGASVYVLKNELGQFHLIFGAAGDTPKTSAGLNALYGNAPNGSIYCWMDGGTTPRLAIKFGNIGLKTGSFLFSSADYATL